MSRRLVVREAATDDIADAADWYDEQKDGLGDDLNAEVFRLIDLVAERPESFPVVHGTFRRALVDRFPYCVFFMSQSDTVVIVAVLHTSRDHPAVLKKRS